MQELPNQFVSKNHFCKLLRTAIFWVLDLNMLGVVASRIATRIHPNVAQATRKMTVVSGPPKVRISFAEKVAHGIAITVGISIVPVYVMVNLKNYRVHETE